MIDSTQVPAGIVVLNYNGLTCTLECMASLLAAHPAPREIVLVDNGSADDSVRELKARYGDASGISLLFLDKNLGYAGGMNAGIRQLLKNGKIRVILLLNNDTAVQSGFLEPLMRCLEDESGYHLATPKILYGDGRTIWSAGERVFYPLLFACTSKGQQDSVLFDCPRKINGITGCAMAVRKEVFEKIGFFDENYFAYVEEVDFCKRALDAGFRLAYCPASVIQHRVAGSLRALSPWHAYLNARNKAYFIKKNVTPFLWPVSGIWYCIVIIFWAAKAVFKGKYDVVRSIFRGVSDFIRGKMGPPDWMESRRN